MITSSNLNKRLAPRKPAPTLLRREPPPEPPMPEPTPDAFSAEEVDRRIEDALQRILAQEGMDMTEPPAMHPRGLPGSRRGLKNGITHRPVQGSKVGSRTPVHFAREMEKTDFSFKPGTKLEL